MVTNWLLTDYWLITDYWITELSGRRRQSPIALGGEDQSLGTKDTLSIEIQYNMDDVLSRFMNASTWLDGS